MTIINREVTALGPLLHVAHFLLGLRHVENDAHTVFIIVALDALMCVGRITGDITVGF